MKNNIWLDIKNCEACIAGRSILNGINLRLRLGESTSIIGPNGAGKSCIVKLIDRSIHPVISTGSHFKLFGSTTVNIWKLRSKLGIVNTELEKRFPSTIDGKELILSGFFGSMRLGKNQFPSRKQEEQADSLIEKLGLKKKCTEYFRNLSDGEKRRFMIARALVHKPKVLVLDEPCRALDLRASHQLIQIMRNLCQNNVTIVQVTHRIETILPEMNRIILLNHGRILGDGNQAEMLTDEKLSRLFNTPLKVLVSHGYRQVIPG